MAVDVSIIIVNYRTGALVKNCIDSVIKHAEDVSYEIIVIDNASEDISWLNSESVRTVQLDENLGFGGANNIGAALACGEMLFFLNPDTVLLNNAVDILYDAIRRLPDCGVCGANLYDVDLKPLHSYFYCTMSLKHTFRSIAMPAGKIHHIKNQHNFSDGIKSVEYITGADLMITKALFDEIGGFNGDIFMYYEDVDLCSRVRRMGKKCYSVPQAKIQHLEGQSFNPTHKTHPDVAERKRKMSGDSIAQFLKSNYGVVHYRTIIDMNIFILRLKKIMARIVSKSGEGAQRQLDFMKYIKEKL